MGISLDRLTDYLMTTGTFKRDDIEREFGISRIAYFDIVKVLDDADIFIRGENNARRVDVRLTKEDIIDRLAPTPPSEDISDILSDSTEINTDAVQTVSNPFAYRKISEV